MDRIFIYTDGACRGNPGKGGWGAVILHGDTHRKMCGGENPSTNNRMEMSAAIHALYEIKVPSEIHLYSDSKYLIDGMTKYLPKWKKTNFKDIKNADLWGALDMLSNQHTVYWKWVKGHAGNPLNELADKLANDGVYTNYNRFYDRMI